MRIIILTIVLVSAISLGFFVHRHPIILKAVAGEARVLSPPLDATTKINGVVQPSAKCFAMKSLWDGKPTDSIVLWLKDSRLRHEVIIVDRQYRDVGRPNYGETNYDLLLNRYLFQAESGVLYASFKSAKSFAQDPKLEIADNHIKFVIPKSLPYEEMVVEIDLPSPSAA